MLTIAAVTVAVGYLALCAALFVFQRRLLFPAPHAVAKWGAPVGTTRCTSGTPTVVHFHGNAECVADLGWLARWWGEQGVGFCAVEYPGYGEAPGETTEAGVYAAAEAALKELEQRVPREQLVLVGQSLGTGPAVEMAARGWGTRLVLLTPFTSVPDAAQLAFPFAPARWLVRDRFDSASKAAQVKVPVLVVHGDDDEVVPYALGQRLTPMFSQGALMTVPGGHHNDLWDKPAVQQRIFAFVTGK